jgi:nucleoside-diphosphate-sugar epimerase
MGEITVQDTERTIAVLGANGRLGAMAARAFVKEGWQVRAVTRNGSTAIEGATGVACDALSAADVMRATQGVACVFNGLNPPYDKWPAMVMPLARNVMDAGRRNGFIHLFPGNVYNYGHAIPARPTEDTPFSGDHRKAAIRIEVEQLFRSSAEKGEVRTAILRAGDFFGGTGTGSWFDMVIASKAAKGTFTYPGPLDLVHSWAYLPDLAVAFVKLADKASTLPAFSQFNFGGHNVTGAQLKAAMETAVGKPLKAASLPWPMIKLGGLVYPMWRELGEMDYLWKQPHALDRTRLVAVVGNLPNTPLEKAVADALRCLGIATGRPKARPDRTPTLAA